MLLYPKAHAISCGKKDKLCENLWISILVSYKIGVTCDW